MIKQREFGFFPLVEEVAIKIDKEYEAKQKEAQEEANI
jgi:hypothetical protein